MYIIVGLGNPGKKYEKTRHNVGFNVIDEISKRNGIEVKKEKFNALIGEGFIGEEKLILVKPMRYMNLSGQAVSLIYNFYKIEPENLIIVYDDIDIPLGNIRIRKQGGAGTHNGMKSICSSLGFKNFPRIRVGIGNDGEDLIDYVIGKVPKKEQEILRESALKAGIAAEDILKFGIDRAMNMDNSKRNED